jgi:hypothetical protein
VKCCLVVAKSISWLAITFSIWRPTIGRPCAVQSYRVGAVAVPVLMTAADCRTGWRRESSRRSAMRRCPVPPRPNRSV